MRCPTLRPLPTHSPIICERQTRGYDDSEEGRCSQHSEKWLNQRILPAHRWQGLHPSDEANTERPMDVVAYKWLIGIDQLELPRALVTRQGS